MRIDQICFLTLTILTAFSSCEKNQESTTFFWDETSCADPWKQDSDDTEEERKESIENYLGEQNVKVENIKFEFDSTRIQLCEACHCTTGRIIIVKVSWYDKRKMRKLDFYQ